MRVRIQLLAMAVIVASGVQLAGASPAYGLLEKPVDGDPDDVEYCCVNEWNGNYCCYTNTGCRITGGECKEVKP
jgi:hypothetical protein